MNGLSRFPLSQQAHPQCKNPCPGKQEATHPATLTGKSSPRIYYLVFFLLTILYTNIPATFANHPKTNNTSTLTSALTSSSTQPLGNILGFAGDDPITLDLNNYFDIPAKETPEYQVILNSFPDVAGTDIQDNMLTITLSEPGQTSIRIMASHQGNEAEIAFLVGVMPVIEGAYETADLSNLTLDPESYWNGSDESGGFESGLAFFPNHHNPDWGSWSGWAYSNKSDTTTQGWANQYSAITGEAMENSNEDHGIYALSFVADPGTVLSYANPSAHEVKGLFVTNTTYAALSMKYGDAYAKKFGGITGDDPDWFMLTITGHRDGNETGSVDYYLADYRFDNNDKNYIIKTWQWFELSSLGKVDSLMFELSSSDMGDWGMNTPAYFAADNIFVVPDLPPKVSNPIENITVDMDAGDMVLDIANVFTDPDDDDEDILISVHENTNPDLVQTSLEEHSLALSIAPSQEGAAGITLKALSNEKSVMESFTVTVGAHSTYQYIYEVLEYTPAPGQFINKNPWGTPDAAESIVGTINGALSLGAFGGHVVFRFEDVVQNHPDNPYGVDFILFGNPTPTWSEPATVWVMKDENRNGLPDGTWYQLAGSDYYFSTTKHDYEVTYFNPHTDTATDVPWEDNYGNHGYIYANSNHTQPYYPDHDMFPQIHPDQYTLSGTRIEGALDFSRPAQVISHPRAFGYADNTPRNVEPFNVPDNPYTEETENAGGDGFDISWAVDEEGNHIELDEVHFIKVQTAMVGHGGWLGEISAEITGAVIVEPDSNISGTMDMVAIKDLPPVITQSPFSLEAYAFHKGKPQADENILWETSLEGAWVDGDDYLHFNTSGELTLTAYLQDDPEVFAEVSTTLDYEPTSATTPEKGGFRMYPNPAADHITIEADREMHVAVYDIHGTLRWEIHHPRGMQIMDIGHLQSGVYLLIGTHKEGREHQRLIIR